MADIRQPSALCGDKNRGRKQLHLHGSTAMPITHANDSASSTTFCPHTPFHRPGYSSLCDSLISAAHLTQASSMVGQTQLQQLQSLEEGASSPMASRGQITSLPAQEDTYPCVLGIPPSLRSSSHLLQGSWCQAPWLVLSSSYLVLLSSASS